MRTIGEHFAIHYSRVSRIVRNAEPARARGKTSYPEIPGRIRINDIINADVTAGPAEADKTLGHRACESDKSADPCFSFVDSER